MNIAAVVLALVIGPTAKTESIHVRLLPPVRTCFGDPDDGRRFLIWECEITIPRCASVMGWGSTPEVARRNAIEAYQRRMKEVEERCRAPKKNGSQTLAGSFLEN